MVEERRQYQRFRAYLPVRLLTPTPATPQTIETLTKDLSVGGMRCISPTVCPISTEVGIDLVLASGDEQFSVRGKTVWFRAIPESEQFEFGIRFSSLSEKNQRRLSAYIERLATRIGLVPA